MRSRSELTVASYRRLLLPMRILSTLPEEYFDFRTTWESVQREQRTVEYLLECLTMIEIRIAKREDDTRSQVATSALVVQDDFKHLQKKKFVDKYNSKPKKYYNKVQCYACKQFGHTQVKCPSSSSAPVREDCCYWKQYCFVRKSSTCKANMC
jgi:hypothetical protein